MANLVDIGSFKAGQGQRPFLIAGPCVIGSEQLAIETAGRIAEIAKSLGIPYVFKSSFDKANRTSIKSFRGPGLEKGLQVLAKVKRQVGVPILTDVHTEEQATEAGQVVDVLQIPAFLCRQTDLLIAAANTGKVVNVKKGQFLSPLEMANAVKKIEECGNRRIVLTERGSSFGYNNLVVDMRALPIMRALGHPVILDATHSVQLPGADRTGTQSGGQPEFIFPIARAGVAAGHEALVSNNVGHDNTAVGCSALSSNTNGNNNTAIGSGAGSNLTSGDNNIYIGNAGQANESNTIRIGNDSSVATFLSGINGINVVGLPVLVSVTGQLGITVSSERFKDDITSMGDASEAVFGLKPVTFHYKKQFDPNRIPQYGLVAEQVAKVDPDLVVRDKEGKIMTVRYDAVNAMLLNEFLKEHRKVQEMQQTIGALTTKLEEQAAQIQKVSAQLELSKSTPELVAHNR